MFDMTGYKTNTYLILYIFIVIGQQTCNGSPTAKVIQGSIEGYLAVSYKGKKFSAFEGIPYAKPPIGELRFKDPLPAEKWNGLLIANKSSMCSQFQNGFFLGSEDCLHLNVYVPKKAVNPNDNMDVVIHIHGGAFKKGSALTEALPDYVMDKDFIVVTMNYRLGAVGFLSTDNEVIPGNMGLKDQNLAIKWIKNNIKSFGGNPNSITLTGFSAGGVCVHYHLISPMSTGLFNRAYSISGTALNPRSLEKEPLDDAKKLSEQLKCPLDTTQIMVECLRQKPIEKLINTTISFGPTIEKGNTNRFLPDHPYKMIKQGNIIDVPWISTNVAEEAYFLINDIYKERRALEVLDNWIVEGSNLLKLNSTVEQADLVNTLEKIRIKYFGNGNLTEDEAICRLNRVMTDRHFFVGSDLVLRSQTAVTKSPIYYYISKFVPEDYLQCGGKPTAASHCVDDKLLFKFTTNPLKLMRKEEKMILLLTQALEHFAKTGIPKIGGTKWLPIDPSKNTLNVLSIQSPDDIKMIEKCQQISEGIPTVKVIQGNIEGYLSESYKGKIFAAFEGIPFAKPPVGVLRFKQNLSLSKNSTLGIDGIDGRALRAGTAEISETLALLINKPFELGVSHDRPKESKCSYGSMN
ncbi:hypothetical protein HHI36_001935 [Cryptolaemus montrouzieri]|uniref:Carboxylic ester hydrolase n=1 Tax=Cryptolaemus montrouzieri TaxID=559131 RepID=A0ABD2P8Y1_9CUCU